MYKLLINNKSYKSGKAVSGLFLFALACLFLIPVSGAKAQGDLLVTPKRVVFDGSRRVMELNLANTGQDTAKYNVSIVQYRMTEDGAFEDITTPDPGQNFADKYIRFFPRTVTLGPNESQVVKMQLTNTTGLPSGEYRSHVYFRAVPKEVALGEDNSARDTSSVSVKLVPIFGITIPVIIRIGESTAKTTISNLEIETVNDTTQRLSMTLNRSGNMSVYGDLKILYVSPDGKERVAGIVNGIAVYTPNLTRKFRMDLIKNGEINYKQGKLIVSFNSQSDTKPVKYAEAELTLK